MKKILAVGLALVIGAGVVTPVYAAPVQKYKTCQQLNKDYSHGVRKDEKAQDAFRNSKTKKIEYRTTKAVISLEQYNKNKHLDRDKDGIACEK